MKVVPDFGLDRGNRPSSPLGGSTVDLALSHGRRHRLNVDEKEVEVRSWNG